MHQSRMTVRLLVIAGAALAAVAFATPAQAKTPAPGYERFAGCPTPQEYPAVVGCVQSVVKGGHFQMGSKDVPITQPMTLTGGVAEGLQGFKYNSEGGLSKAKQIVPGGVIGLTGLTWLLEFFGSNALTLYATTELAGTPQLGFTDLTLPIKVHLETPSGVLGKKCYVGSNSNPIVLNLTTGTTSPPPPNKPISGKEPEFGFDPESSIVSMTNGTYVDNSFSAPGASGCTLTLFGFLPLPLSGIVNLQAGLPAAAGTNETVQNTDTEIAEVQRVYP